MKVLHSICQQMWKTQQRPQDWKRLVIILIPKKGNAKECSNYCTIGLISYTSKVMLKILQARLQQYVNRELPDVQEIPLLSYNHIITTTTYLKDRYIYIYRGEGNGNPLQCSCLENPRDRGAWWAAVSGVAQSRTRPKQLSSSSSSSPYSP